MSADLTNLLPPSGTRRIRHGYLLRLLTVALLLGTFVAFVHGLLLLPSHLHASAEVRERTEERARLAQEAETPEGRAAQARIASLEEDIEHLGRLGAAPAASEALEAVLAVPRGGIQIQGIAYTAPASATSTGRMVLSGTAATRESLRAYAGSLEEADGIDEAELPISAYAKESAIPFTITLTGRFAL